MHGAHRVGHRELWCAAKHRAAFGDLMQRIAQLGANGRAGQASVKNALHEFKPRHLGD
eukprot:CAMPEP_0197254182 /NCGR_PEP_ID=MMETSP1429-20130617/67755_1 /TAXON_ID=49237 /ORGANISM="Chaetoceros  sp., Strain UNC1202" /LENGTH=57 /DNA_ID=CAMNT_0042717087 /DNA_START=232 /DNA_END=402 /DNA_ORIENTATION=-